MALLLKRGFLLKIDIRTDLNILTRLEFLRFASTEPEPEPPVDGDRFRRLELYPRVEYRKRTPPKAREIYPPRSLDMTPDQDWTNVWPGPKTFHPASVPLPIRQGCNKHGPPPEKFGNTELMKIPNFLHLTPPAIEKHCNALKKFCTEWPENLKTDEEFDKHFPVEVISSDYCHSSASIRDPKARIMSIRIKLKNLELDKHSKDKFLRLVGPRYDPSTDYVTITTDSCPLKKQNYEYAHYLLTAVYFESWKFENWEKEKSDEDMEEYHFPSRKGYKSVKAIFDYNNRKLPDLDEFGKATEDWRNKGDDKTIVENYKKAVMKLLSVPALETSS